LANDRLRVTIGAALAVVALVVFGVISQNVNSQDPLTRFDVSVLETLRRHTTATGVALGVAISRLGSGLALTILGCAGAVLLAVRREWIVLGGWAAAFTGVGLLDHGLKIAIHRPRPTYFPALIPHPGSWSFPSGHAMGSVVGYGMLAYVLLLVGRGSRPTRATIVAAAVVLVIAIGVSRLYLGVHYFSDVVGGYAAGLVWLSACVGAVEIGRRGQALGLNPTT
jgi:membrane-associated phospholipid phosphatase